MCLIFLFFFCKELRRCPPPRGKRLKNLSRILLLHIILQTRHYGTSADNDLRLYLPRLLGTPGLYLKHAWIRGKEVLFYLFTMHNSLICVRKWPHFGAKLNVNEVPLASLKLLLYIFNAHFSLSSNKDLKQSFFELIEISYINC